MSPIQSRRSRKLRETVYINGQHTNLLKEISNPGPDGTVPLLNFLENTDRFIADTSQLQLKVAILEADLEKYKILYEDFQKMTAYMRQFSHFFTISTVSTVSTTYEQNAIDISNTDMNFILPEFPDLMTEKTNMIDEMNNNDIYSIVSNTNHVDYFKPNTSKKPVLTFPLFNSEHTIKINIENEPVQLVDDAKQIDLLPSTHNRTGNHLLQDIVREIPVSNNQTNDEYVLLASLPSRNIKGQELIDTTPVDNVHKSNDIPLLYNTEPRQSQLKIDLSTHNVEPRHNEIYYHNMVNDQLEYDAEEIANTLLLNCDKRVNYGKHFAKMQRSARYRNTPTTPHNELNIHNDVNKSTELNEEIRKFKIKNNSKRFTQKMAYPSIVPIEHNENVKLPPKITLLPHTSNKSAHNPLVNITSNLNNHTEHTDYTDYTNHTVPKLTQNMYILNKTHRSPYQYDNYQYDNYQYNNDVETEELNYIRNLLLNSDD